MDRYRLAIVHIFRNAYKKCTQLHIKEGLCTLPTYLPTHTHTHTHTLTQGVGKMDIVSMKHYCVLFLTYPDGYTRGKNTINDLPIMTF